VRMVGEECELWVEWRWNDHASPEMTNPLKAHRCRDWSWQQSFVSLAKRLQQTDCISSAKTCRGHAR
jgi:hypothetical protein